MLESNLRQRIVATTFLVRLCTGETVIGLVIGHVEGVISLFFPYEITTTGELVQFCEFAKNRRFEISSTNCQFLKSPCDHIITTFFERVLKEHPEGFKDFVTYFTQLLIQEGEASGAVDAISSPIDTQPKERVLH